jgi:hypothetical protein
MKSILGAILLLTSISSHANIIKNGDVLIDYTCKTTAPPVLKFNLKLVATADSQNLENTEMPATLTVKRVIPLGSEVLVIPKVFVGHYKYEDVESNFESTDGNASLTIFADELDQTTLTTFSGGKAIETHFDCN